MTMQAVGRVAALVRYPVKSMGGERVALAEVGAGGVAGDRGWAVYTADGGFGSGKTTRRFRRVEGLLDLRARLDGDGAVPLVRFPDGRERRADDPAAARALNDVFGRPLWLRAQAEVSHHDECPVHLVTTAALRHLEQVAGGPVPMARFRANVLLEVDGAGFVEDRWQGRELALGDEVVLRLGPGMPRCVMVGLPQPHDGLAGDDRLLKTLGRAHRAEFGLQAAVLRRGVVREGDPATLV